MKQTLLLITFTLALLADAQVKPFKNFAEVKRKMNAHFDSVGKQSPEYKQWKRLEWYYSTRTGEGGMMVNNAKLNREALQASSVNRNAKTLQTTANTGSWSALGPSSVNSADKGIGRVNRIAFHPTNQNIMYVASATGGLWITSDAGANWFSYSEGIPNMSLSGVAVDYTNPNVIYILTGDADAVSTSTPNSWVYGKTSVGVLKSYDGGFTWYRTGLQWIETDDVVGYKLMMHPSNPSILFVATNEGIYRTTNAGANWTVTTSNTDPIYDMEFQPGNPSIVYACGTEADSIVLIKSTNTGQSFTKTHGIKREKNFENKSVSNRSAIAVSAANSSYVYLLAGPCTGASEFQGFYRSTNSGESFSQRTNSPNILGGSQFGTDKKDQHAYDLAVAVSPTNISRVACGGIRLWTSANGGTSFAWQDDNESSLSYYHPDIHDMAYHPLNSNKLYMCGDGGVYVSSDDGDNWTSVSGNLAVTQYYKIAASTGELLGQENIVIGGTQDNGTNKRGVGGGATFLQINGSDGMDCLIDPDNLNTYIVSSQNGVFYHSVNAGSDFLKFADSNIVATAIDKSIKDRWVTPVAEIAGGSTKFVLGYSPVVLATFQGAWTFEDLGWSGLTFVKTARGNASRIFIGDNDRLSSNLIKTTTNQGTSWSTVLDEANGIPVTDLAFDPTNGNRIWISYGGYSPTRKVRFSNDGGANWSYINGTLPNVPINCILYDGSSGAAPDALYVGTDIGVFYRDNNLADWIPFSNSLPVVEITDLEMHPTLGCLRAGTYGRGIWETSRYSSCPSTINLTASNTAIFKPYYFQASTSINSTAQHIGTGANVFYKAGTEIVITPGFTASADGGNVFEAALGPCGGGVPTKVGATKQAKALRGFLVD